MRRKRTLMHPDSNKYLENALRVGFQLEFEGAFTAMAANENVYTFSGLNVPIVTTTTNLDVVAVVGKHILVGEMKNYQGFLMGGISDPVWSAGSKGRYLRIQNPIKQNRFHVNNLTRAMVNSGIIMRGLRILDYVVVPDTCKLEVPEVLRKVVIPQTRWEALISELSYFNKDGVRLDVINKFREWV